MIRFVKTHGIGNDFVLLDGIREGFPGVDFPSLSVAMCHRRTGIGADGLLLAEKLGPDHFRMRMWNPDGSESEMCGNGIRCLAKYLVEEGHSKSPTMPVETGAGRLEPSVLADGRVRVDMGLAGMARGEIGMAGDPAAEFRDEPVAVGGKTFPGTAVSMGNPHLVIFVEDVSAVPLDVWGPELEHHPQFPNRVNVHFAQVLSRRHLRQRTWERGAGATLACGTGACAVAAAAQRTGRSEDCVLVSLPGGDLELEARVGENVFMTGPAVEVFRGVWRD